MRLTSLIFTTFTLSSTVVYAANCAQGQYVDSNHQCQYCAPGTYSNQTPNTSGTTTCQPSQAGWYACGPQTVNGQSCYGAPNQQQCPAGTYGKNGGVSSCTTCPAGSFCQSTGQTSAQKCSPGYFAGSTGSTACTACQPGTFNNVNGATRCCRCCAGTYQDQTSQTHCLSCYEHTNPHQSYSPVGSSNVNQCQASPINGVTNNASCSNSSNNNNQDYCPSEQGDGSANPNPSPLDRKRDGPRCPPGKTLCPVLHGRGGKECLDTESDPESCGGCLEVDPHTTGKDCTSIEDADRVSCVRGKCVIESCRKGYTVGLDGKSCVRSARSHARSGSQHATRSKKQHARNPLQRTL
ncbi:hypothetical protein FRC05_006213 [Tulasnella sp. 425]|nr:hypothetical protein FRC05_006213 [Tulasnella sp. 425]